MQLYRKYTASCSKIQSLGKKGLGPKTLWFKQNLAVLKRYSLFRYFSQFCCSVVFLKVFLMKFRFNSWMILCNLPQSALILLILLEKVTDLCSYASCEIS